jgi:hypothetical protein
MRDELIKRSQQADKPEMRLNQLREELHHLILQEADRKGVFRHLAFIGGTALRILHKLNRYSEDLDFSLSENASTPFQFEAVMIAVQKSISAYGLSCELQKLKTVGAVHSCFFSFSDILHDVHPQFRVGQKLAIKLDADLKPPAGATEGVSPVGGLRVYKVRHYDLPSLLAGKLHAILLRPYTKGRDLYDFLWYAGHRIAPNMALLQNAIRQTQGSGMIIDSETLRKLLVDRFNATDFNKAKNDVERFLVDAKELDLFEQEVFLGAVNQIQI